jgi:hypothetical protein
MPPTAEVEPMSEATQDNLFSLSVGEQARAVRDKFDRLDALIAGEHKLNTQRLALVDRLNHAQAQYEDFAHAVAAMQPTDARVPEALASMRTALIARDALQESHNECAERYRAVRIQVARAKLDADMAARGHIQRELGDAAAPIPEPVEVAEPERITTNRDMRQIRQQRARDQAVMTLRAMPGGRGSCVDLARLLGLSPHGLGGLIDGDERIVKYHTGRQANLETWYRLAEGAE